MLKRTSQVQYQVDQLIDAAIAALSFTLAIGVRRWLRVWWPDVFPMFDALWSNAWLYILLVPLWLFLLDISGFYLHRSIRPVPATLRAVARANVLGVIIVFFILYILKIQHIPRALILLYGALDTLLMAGKEVLIRRFEPLWTKTTNVLLVGSPAALKDVRQRLARFPSWRVRILGVLVPAPSDAELAKRELGEAPVVGGLDDLERVLHEQSVDYVVIAPGAEHFAKIQQMIAICETEGVETWLAADFFRPRIARAEVDEFEGLPMLVFSTTPALSLELLLKRLIDVIGSLALIVVAAPFMLVIALLIKTGSRGPILFKQRRCTLHGRTFNMYKFRTMVTEAEELRKELESRNEMAGPVFKIRDDPRITPVGRFLRRHSLDELPQLFNVLFGDMSLVGPRPPIPSEVAKYENWQRRRLSMRSGITCLWQVSGRNETGFDEWMKLDLEYIDNWSLALDIRILFKTPMAMIKGTGF